jgi:hypothetical protein
MAFRTGRLGMRSWPLRLNRIRLGWNGLFPDRIQSVNGAMTRSIKTPNTLLELQLSDILRWMNRTIIVVTLALPCIFTAPLHV